MKYNLFGNAMQKSIITFLSGLILFFPFKGLGQHLPLSHSLSPVYMQAIRQADTSVSTSFKPLMRSSVPQQDYTARQIYAWNRDTNATASWFMRKLRTEPLVKASGKNYTLQINPLLNAFYSTDRVTDSVFFTNTRGIMIQGTLGDKFSFYSSFRENQAYFPAYINRYVHSHVVVPGQGLRKSFGENNQGHDFSQAAGYIAFRPAGFMHVRVGHHKHFVGEGYRSLLLSDNSSNYPFVDVKLEWKKWTYHLLFAELQDLTGRYYDYHYRKLASFYYLTYKPASWLELGLFQGIKWQTGDTATSRKVPAMFYSPLIFSQPAVYGLNSKHNALIGLQISADISPLMQVYGQLAIDELPVDGAGNFRDFTNQTGVQVGVQYFDWLHGSGKWHQLFTRLEWNLVRPYTYAHSTRFMEYTQLNQPLAHPLGAGFRETIGQLQYRFRDFSLAFRYNYAVTSKDTAMMHTGSNIFLPDDEADFGPGQTTFVGQGMEHTIRNIKAKVNYLLNPVYNFNIFAGIHFRKASYGGNTRHTKLIMLGMRTNLANFYFDF